MEEFDENGPITVNYELIANDDNMPPFLRSLAFDVRKCTYMRPGDFFRKARDADIDYIMESLDAANYEGADEDENVTNVILLAIMLSTAEGVEIKDEEDVHERTNQLAVMTAMTSLARKGLIRVYYENMSFGEDMGDKLVAEKI